MIKELLSGYSRETLLKVGAGIAAGLFLLNWLVIDPAIEAWGAQSDRIRVMQEKVDKGQKLLSREKTLRARWNEMLNSDLAEDSSAAEDSVYTAINRWTRESRITFTSLTPQWRPHEEEGYDTFECRATANGDQLSLARMLFEIEHDKLPARVEDCELNVRDPKGQQLSMAVRFTFVRLNKTAAASISNATGAKAAR